MQNRLMNPSIARLPTKVSYSNSNGLTLHRFKGSTDRTVAFVHLGLGLLLVPFLFADSSAHWGARLILIVSALYCLVRGIQHFKEFLVNVEIHITPAGYLTETVKSSSDEAKSRFGQVAKITSKKQTTYHGLPNHHIFAVLQNGEEIFLFTYNHMVASINKSSELLSEAVIGLRMLKVAKSQAFDAIFE